MTDTHPTATNLEAFHPKARATRLIAESKGRSATRRFIQTKHTLTATRPL